MFAVVRHGGVSFLSRLKQGFDSPRERINDSALSGDSHWRQSLSPKIVKVGRCARPVLRGRVLIKFKSVGRERTWA